MGYIRGEVGDRPPHREIVVAKTFRSLSSKVPEGVHRLAFTVAELRGTTASRLVRQAIEDAIREELGERALRRATDKELNTA